MGALVLWFWDQRKNTHTKRTSRLRKFLQDVCSWFPQCRPLFFLSLNHGDNIICFPFVWGVAGEGECVCGCTIHFNGSVRAFLHPNSLIFPCFPQKHVLKVCSCH